jgi:hypothetical protein
MLVTSRSPLEGWDRTTLAERRRRIRAGFVRDADVPEALRELRKLEAEAGGDRVAAADEA